MIIHGLRNPASELRKNQRTPEVKRLSSKDMREVESLAEDAPPLVWMAETGSLKQAGIGRSGQGHVGHCLRHL